MIIGNDAANRITGGGGSDTIVFNTLATNNVDRITDFSVNDDTIELDNNVFANLREGFLEQDALRRSVAHDNSDRIINNRRPAQSTMMRTARVIQRRRSLLLWAPGWQ